MGFGNNLKKILKRKRITIKELSSLTGISINTLYSITKRDTRVPNKRIVDKIVNALQIDESEIITYDVMTDEIKHSLDEMRGAEENFREKLFAICEELNVDALFELLKTALDMYQYESYRSIFNKKDN